MNSHCRRRKSAADAPGAVVVLVGAVLAVVVGALLDPPLDGLVLPLADDGLRAGEPRVWGREEREVGMKHTGEGGREAGRKEWKDVRGDSSSSEGVQQQQ